MKRSLRAAFYVGPLLAWMALIFWLSTGHGSSQHTTLLIERVLRRLSPAFLASLNAYQLDCLDYALRKSAHFVEYLFLTLLAFRAMQYGRPRLRGRVFLGALLLGVLYAASDEIHQVFVRDRSPAVRDVLIDSSGAAFALLLLLVWFGLKGVERSLRDERRKTVDERRKDEG